MRRRNPDEEIRNAARRYLQTRDEVDKAALVGLQRRTGMTCQREETHPGSKLPVSEYCDYCHAFICDLCLHNHNRPLPPNFYNTCVHCNAIFSEDNPCYNSAGSSDCFQHYHKEGYCARCWPIREAEIQHEVDTDNDYWPLSDDPWDGYDD